MSQLSRVLAKLLKLAGKRLAFYWHIEKFRQIPCQRGYWDKNWDIYRGEAGTQGDEAVAVCQPEQRVHPGECEGRHPHVEPPYESGEKSSGRLIDLDFIHAYCYLSTRDWVYWEELSAGFGVALRTAVGTATQHK